MPVLCVGLPQKSLFCGADFGSTFALDLQQKLKPFLHSSQEPMAIRSFAIVLQTCLAISWINEMKIPGELRWCTTSRVAKPVQMIC